MRSLSRTRIPAAEKLAALEPILRLYQLKARGKRPPLGPTPGSISSLVREAARTLQACESTVWFWLRSLRLTPYAAIAPLRADVGRSRFFRGHPWAARVVRWLSETKPPVTSEAFRALRKFGALYGEVAPSRETVRAYLRQQQSNGRTRARRPTGARH